MQSLPGVLGVPLTRCAHVHAFAQQLREYESVLAELRGAMEAVKEMHENESMEEFEATTVRCKCLRTLGSFKVDVMAHQLCIVFLGAPDRCS